VSKWIMSALITVACLFGIVLLVYGLPDKEKKAESSATFTVPDKPIDAPAAEQIYKSNCLSCHGDQLQGGMGPALNQVGTSMSKEKIYKQIMNGGGGMPKFGGRLSDDEVITLTNWLADKK